MNVVQHVEAAADAMLDEHPGVAEWHIARAQLVAGRSGRTVAELVDDLPALAELRGVVAPAIAALRVMSA